MSFRNTWVRSLALRLPMLALAIDDALVAFVERVLAVLSCPLPPMLAYNGLAEPLHQTPRQASLAAMRSSSFVSPARSSAYFDLSR